MSILSGGCGDSNAVSPVASIYTIRFVYLAYNDKAVVVSRL
jgi:hypothetical protein